MFVNGPALVRAVGWTTLEYISPATPTGNDGTLRVYNSRAGDANFVVDDGGADPEHHVLETTYVFETEAGVTDADASASYPAAPTGDAFTIHGQGSQGLVTL